MLCFLNSCIFLTQDESNQALQSSAKMLMKTEARQSQSASQATHCPSAVPCLANSMREFAGKTKCGMCINIAKIDVWLEYGPATVTVTTRGSTKMSTRELAKIRLRSNLLK